MLPFHPYAESYPLLQGDEYESFKADIATNGPTQPIRYRMVDGEKQGLDGRNRQRAGKELGIDWPEEEVAVPDEQVETYIDSLNLHRRHLGKDERKSRVAALRAKGRTTRQIAQTLGVSQSTVVNDLANSVEQNCSTENNSQQDAQEPTPPPPQQPAKVTGKDGKSYAASKPKAEPVLCARCSRNERTGQEVVKGCPMCKEARGGPKKAPKQQPEGEAPKDDYGNEIPKRCRDAFCDPWLRQTFDSISVLSAEFRKARHADGMNKRAKRYPFFNAKDFIDGCGFVIQYLDNLLEHIKQNEPSGVCPSCEGKGCGHCRMSGMVPRSVYKELKAKS